MGFDIASSHHEIAPAQHEIEFKEDEAVKAANASKDPVLWIKAKTQSGLPKSFAIDLSTDEDK